MITREIDNIMERVFKYFIKANYEGLDAFTLQLDLDNIIKEELRDLLLYRLDTKLDRFGLIYSKQSTAVGILEYTFAMNKEDFDGIIVEIEGEQHILQIDTEGQNPNILHCDDIVNCDNIPQCCLCPFRDHEIEIPTSQFKLTKFQ